MAVVTSVALDALIKIGKRDSAPPISPHVIVGWSDETCLTKTCYSYSDGKKFHANSTGKRDKTRIVHSSFKAAVHTKAHSSVPYDGTFDFDVHSPHLWAGGKHIKSLEFVSVKWTKTRVEVVYKRRLDAFSDVYVY